MTQYGAFIRSQEGVETALRENRAQQSRLSRTHGLTDKRRLPDFFRLRELLIAQFVYLSAIDDYIRQIGVSRNSYLVYNKNGTLPHEGVAECFRNVTKQTDTARLQEIVYDRKTESCRVTWRPVRGLPDSDQWFETAGKNTGRRYVSSSLKADRTGEDDMAGIKDVAEYCGVSLSTVSRTMTGSAKVSPETRQKVLQAVKKLNYKPNMTAQMLKSGSARLIGLIIPDIVNPYYPQIVKTLEDLAMEAGYSIILCDAQGDAKREKNYFETLQRLCVDGILYVPSTEDVEFVREYAERIAMVIINRTFDINAPCINICNEEATNIAIRYLLNMGHRKIALYMNNTHRQYNVERLRGCEKAFEDAGVTDYKPFIQRDLDEDDIYEKTVRLMNLPDQAQPAVFMFNDNMAFGVYRGILDCGLHIPDDVSVMGFDDIPTAKYMAPPLTTIRHATYDTLKVIFNNLMYQINTREFGEGSITYYKAKLVERQSVRRIENAEPEGE